VRLIHDPRMTRPLRPTVRTTSGLFGRGEGLRERRVAAEVAMIQAGDVIDDELSRAVVAYLRGAGLAWPHRSLEAVSEVMGADAAERLRPTLERLADETLYWPVDRGRHDRVPDVEEVRSGMMERHPELSGGALEALIWEFSYVYR
jgi:hypothetical protein